MTADGCSIFLVLCTVNFCKGLITKLYLVEPRPCPQVKCARQCPNGYKTDENGCQTCECRKYESVLVLVVAVVQVSALLVINDSIVLIINSY